jgi:acetyltransferase-like isoleucine patch superfamily enzyme/glycosyltransferase involved in cell wall biosynthesis
MKLLTIIVPTYNRANCLTLLFDTLEAEVAGFEDLIDIVIGDNASTDHTPALTAAFKRARPSAIILRHAENLGPDENFCRCLEEVHTPYFWIIGDDDLPKTGVVRHLLGILIKSEPDLLYLHSEWRTELKSPSDGLTVTQLRPFSVTRQDFARVVNVWVTFISGMIVNLARLRQFRPDISLRQYSGTSLVQLSWVLPLLLNGNRFQIVPEPCVLATAGNTGGYSLVRVFAANFDRILLEAGGPSSTATNFIAHYNRLVYLPRLIWHARFGSLGNFEAENYVQSMDGQRHRLAYWLLLRPISVYPRVAASALFMVSRLTSRIIRMLTQARLRWWSTIGRFCDIYERISRRGRSAINRLRGLLIQPFLAECAGPLSVGASFLLIGRRNVSCLGPFTALDRNRIEALERHGDMRYKPTIVIGANVTMENDCHIGAIDRIEIHDNVLLASKVYISDHSHGTTALTCLQVPPNLRRVVSKGPVIIEADVWLGEGVAVMPGVRIGRSSVIGANSVVTRDIPPYSIAGGAPARVFSRRTTSLLVSK